MVYELSNEMETEFAFVLSALYSGAIKFDEFKEYLYLFIKQHNSEDIPLFIWDLIDMDKDQVAYIYNVIGYTLISRLNKQENLALYGIAIQRFGSSFEIEKSNEHYVVKALDNNPNILSDFKETFPFISLWD